MAIKIKIPTQKEPIELKQPAFLVGNGINYAEGCKLSWEQLLIDISGRKTGFKKHLAGLTYPEIAEMLLSQLLPEEYDEEIKPKFISGVKNRIKNHIENEAESNDCHKNLVKFAFEHDIPILTTNFDRNFLKTPCFEGQNPDSIKLQWINQAPKAAKDYQTMKNACFSPKEISNIHSEFAIWPIHGVVGKKTCPLCLTNWDYGNYCAKIKEISKAKEWEKQQNDSTWIDILLDNDLIIMGLGLNYDETDLRFLLAERRIKQKVANKDKDEKTNPKIIYIYRKEAEETEMPFGKREFFEALGIRCVPMNQDDIYEVEKYLK